MFLAIACSTALKVLLHPGVGEGLVVADLLTDSIGLPGEVLLSTMLGKRLLCAKLSIVREAKAGGDACSRGGACHTRKQGCGKDLLYGHAGLPRKEGARFQHSPATRR